MGDYCFNENNEITTGVKLPGVPSSSTDSDFLKSVKSTYHTNSFKSKYCSPKKQWVFLPANHRRQFSRIYYILKKQSKTVLCKAH